MTDEKTPTDPDAQPTEPLPASVEPPAAPATTSAPVAATATAPAKSPWPVLIPVFVGVGALLLGGILGGAAGFAVGAVAGSHRGDHGSSVELRMPDHPRGGDGQGPQDAPSAPNGQFQRGSIVTGTITELADGSLTLELSNGDTVNLSVAADTPVVEANASSVDSLATGDKITVVVTGNGDGTPEARLIRTGDADLSSLGGAPGR